MQRRWLLERFLAGTAADAFPNILRLRDTVRSLIEQREVEEHPPSQNNTLGHFSSTGTKSLAKRAHTEQEERERRVWEHKLQRREVHPGLAEPDVADAFSQWRSNWRDID